MEADEDRVENAGRSAFKRVTSLARRLAAVRRRKSARSTPSPEPNPGEALLAEARAHASHPALLEAICGRALIEAPDELLLLFEIGGVARDAGLVDVAERVYAHIVHKHPDSGYAAVHYARICAARGDDGQALSILEGVRTSSVYDRYINALFAEILFRLGRTDEAAERLHAASDPAAKMEAAARADFVRFATDHPKTQVMELLRQIENGPDYIDAAAVAELARAALRNRNGFSLVRIGDGEGAFLKLSPEDEAHYPGLYARNQEDRAAVWFDGQLDLTASGFTEEVSRLTEVMRNATVLGLPYTGWLEHEHRIGSITGISSLTNVVRWAAAQPEGRRLCIQVVNLQLGHEGHLRALLDEVDEIGLIACHPHLPERLQQRFSLKDVEFHKLPGEKALLDLIGEAAAEGTHYPDVFRHVMAALDRPLNGKLFLVAGGILGKFYCERIRASSGVALDIGSLADGWVGAITRPTIGPAMVL